MKIATGSAEHDLYLFEAYSPYLKLAGMWRDELDAMQVFSIAGKIISDVFLHRRVLAENPGPGMRTKEMTLAALGKFTDQERQDLQKRVGRKSREL